MHSQVGLNALLALIALALDMKVCTHYAWFLLSFSALSSKFDSHGIDWLALLFLKRILGMKLYEWGNPCWRWVYGTFRTVWFLIRSLSDAKDTLERGHPGRSTRNTWFYSRSFPHASGFHWAWTVFCSVCKSLICGTLLNVLLGSWCHTFLRSWGISWYCADNSQSEWRFWIQGKVWDSYHRFLWVIRPSV